MENINENGICDVTVNSDNNCPNAEGSGAEQDAALPEASPPDARDVRASVDCSDGERAVLQGYVTLVQKCIELAEKVIAVKS